ncbi:cold shock domain-containing protein [Ruminiclostridium herbifermentans]|uniref:cold shock domain-containing protein n=1 Tax=Ruminiclostridium herbifermentans TaxID=2488810 RepID=UPI003CC7DE86
MEDVFTNFNERGFGFTKEKHIFVHIRDVVKGNELQKGDRIEFNIGKDMNERDKAMNVRKINK